MWCPLVQDDCEQGIFGLEKKKCRLWDEEFGCLAVAQIRQTLRRQPFPLGQNSPKEELPFPPELIEKLRQFGEGER